MAKEPATGQEPDTTLTDEVLMPGADYQAICNAVRALTGGTMALKSGDIAPALAGVKPVKTISGTITPSEDTTSLIVPAGGRVINITGQSIPDGEGRVLAVAWSEGAYSVAAQIAAYFRLASNKVVCAALAVSQENGATTFSTNNASRCFHGGSVYTWVAYDWDQEAQG